MVSIIQNARIVTDGKILDNHCIVVKDGVIDTILPDHECVIPDDAATVDLGGKYLSPAWIDLHCHGAGGKEFINGDPKEVIEICKIHADRGTLVLYPTISATDFHTMWRALEAIEQALPECPLEIPGVHLEGPYLSKAMCGAQDTSYITKPVKEEYNALLDRFPKLIARWSYAPEEDDNNEFLNELLRRGVVPAMAHTNADYPDVVRAFEGGNHLVTHLYSCTSTITRHGGFRHLGVTECAYLWDDMYVEAIGDGCHLPPELVRLIVKQKGCQRVCLITDAISFACMDTDAGLVGGTANIPYLLEDGVAKLMDRSAFAGSIASTNVLLKRTVAAGIPLPDTIRMMTETPACAMGLEGYGRIAPGCKALFAAFDGDLDFKGAIQA
ncbi:MAG: N-acetylglucosamine-6-phosphate deacetylase [Clostridiales bacterium]|nr:N-acetylglucosamine-6-phosphate deacetylase [Clostridiales bacterium]